MQQRNDLNFSDQPTRRSQYVAAPVVVADGADVAALETRVDAAEANIAAISATTSTLESATDWSLLVDYADDAAAATGGVAVGSLYRTGSIVKVRVA